MLQSILNLKPLFRIQESDLMFHRSMVFLPLSVESRGRLGGGGAGGSSSSFFFNFLQWEILNIYKVRKQ